MCPGRGADLFKKGSPIDKLLCARGAAAFTVYAYLCCQAQLCEGYYLRWSYADAELTAGAIGGGVKPQAVKQTVATCLHLDLFHRGLFDAYGILTSMGLQQEYLLATRERGCIKVNQKFWLLDEAAGCVKVSPSSTGESKAGKRPGTMTDRKTKDRKREVRLSREEREELDEILRSIFSGQLLYVELAPTIEEYVREMYARSYISVGKKRVSQARVRQRLNQLDTHVVNFVLERFSSADDVRNPRAYLMACLYNAPVDYDAWISIDVARWNKDGF